MLNEVCDDFRVGLGDKRVAEFLQLALHIKIVLDDAVVDHNDLSRAVLVGMRVFFGGAAVRCPTRVAHPVDPLQRLRLNRPLEIDQFASASSPLDLAVPHDSHAGGVVAAIFETPQSLEKYGHNFLGPEIANDSAHGRFPLVRLKPDAILRLLLLIGPALDVPLFSCADGQRSCRYALAHGRSAADIGTFANRDRRDELRAAADEGPIFNDGLMLLLPVVVARDRARADVHALADHGVAEV